MFCSNCGKPLADGAKFCSNCGAKVEAPAAIMTEERPQAPASKKPSYDFGMEWAPSEVAAKPKKAAERKVSFDWSSVIDETHKKPRAEIRSPWDTDGLSDAPQSFTSKPATLEEEIFADAAASKKTEDRGRTLTFIDILKQERSEKERRAYDAARRVEDEIPGGYDSPLPTNTILPEDERIVTQGYTDLKQDIISEMRHSSAREFDKQLESAKERRLGNTALFTPEPPRSFVDDFFTEPKAPAPRKAPETVEDELEAILTDNEPILDEPVYEEPVYEEPAAPAVPAYEEPAADDLFDDVEPEAEPEDSYDEYMDYVPRGRAARNRYVEEEYDDDDDDDYEDEPAEEPAEEVSAVDDEIAALQAKLEMLLKMKSGEAPAPEPADEYLDEEDEEPAEAPAEEIGEYLDENIFDAELKNEEVEEEIEEDIVAVVEETPAVEEPAIEEPAAPEVPAVEEPAAPEVQAVEEPATVEAPAAEEATFDDDAITSIEALLSDLLPQEAISDEPIVAEEPVTEETVVDDEAIDLDAAIEQLAASMEEPAAPAQPAVEEMSMADIDAELAKLGIAEAEPEAPAEPEYKEEDMLFTSETTDTSSDTVAISTEELAAQEAMSIEELEKDLFGPAAEDPESEATKKIEKFYTLYRKNDEFQKLLDAEYDKLQGSKYDGPAPEKELLASEPDIEALTSIVDEPAPAKKVEVPAVAEVKETPAPAPEKKEAKKADKKADKKAEKAAAKEAKKAAKKAKKEIEEDDDEEVKGGGFLTVLAIIVALLLVVLLVIIIVLNFAPESGIAQTLNDVIGNLTSFIASDNTELLL